MLWFTFFFGLKIFKPVQLLFFFVLDSLPFSETRENKNQTDLKIFKPSNKMNHNINKGSMNRNKVIKFKWMCD